MLTVEPPSLPGSKAGTLGKSSCGSSSVPANGRRFSYSPDGKLVSVAIDDATGKLDPSRTGSTAESSQRFDQEPSAAESAEDRIARQKLGALLYQQLLTKPRSLDLTSLTTGDTSPPKEK